MSPGDYRHIGELLSAVVYGYCNVSLIILGYPGVSKPVPCFEYNFGSV